jgi:hypothetical protein
VEQNLNNQHQHFIAGLLSNAGAITAQQLEQLKQLCLKYPQSNVLQALLASAYQSADITKFPAQLNTAATYASNRTILHHLVAGTQKLEPVKQQQIFTKKSFTYKYEDKALEITREPEKVTYFEKEITFKVEDEPATATSKEDDAPFNVPEEESHVADVAAPDYEEYIMPEDRNDDPAKIANEPVVAEEPELHASALTQVTENEEAPLPLQTTLVKQVSGDIEDEVYDEIVGIEDIRIQPNTAKLNTAEPLADIHAGDADQLQSEGKDSETKEDAPMGEPFIIAQHLDKEDISLAEIKETLPEDNGEIKPELMAVPEMRTETDRDIVGNIAATDYFMFNSRFAKRPPLPEVQPEEPAAYQTNEPEREEALADIKDAEPVETVASESQEMAKYNDDTMPYTFMWWLDKTRKEHADNYQPYAISKLASLPAKTAVPDELQQQYYENIFHLTTVEDINKTNQMQTVEFEVKRNEDQIIERFIHEEPQIKPPSMEKVDNENKARKSSEDQDELVTETLAKIYMDQMLYHKAISSYKKLLLKFPEKSSYFEAQIKLLEKKIN